MQVFENRTDAGRQLAARLAVHPAVQEAQRIVVLAVPRGGLPVGAEVAKVLDAAFDVVMVRKLRSPQNPELGFGVVGGDGYVDIDEATVARLGITPEQIEAEVADRRRTLERRLALYREVVSRVSLSEALVIVVDDGIATGGTARQACAFARRGGARSVLLAVPVAPADVMSRLADVADDILVLSTPAEFLSVDQAYADFSRLGDDTAIAALRAAAAKV